MKTLALILGKINRYLKTLTRFKYVLLNETLFKYQNQYIQFKYFVFLQQGLQSVFVLSIALCDNISNGSLALLQTVLCVHHKTGHTVQLFAGADLGLAM